MLLHSILTAMLILAPAVPRDPPTVVVSTDNTRITESCTIKIPLETVIVDSDNNGVIHVEADDITLTFAEGPDLRGAKSGTPGDQLKGIGIRINSRKNVTIQYPHVSGFQVGIHATNCPNLRIDSADLRDIFRQRLKSTPQTEDQSDWLWPHRNDNHEWRTNYGAAICIEQSNGITISNTTVRDSQNGIILDRVNDSQVYDNDCSFLSGWGLAMWRSSRNFISKNAFDFCIRGYSHGVYNRGQDSAGILCFEQCCRNNFMDNSVTHGGDGFFAFAGHEALGESPAPTPDFDYKARGCNNNYFSGNDFSYAAAHGLELTFSFGNQVWRNQFIENAICGIWGGYSQGTVIADNTFERNGLAGYGAERGGVNIEHGTKNAIRGNHFKENACGVHLWWDTDEGLTKLPWATANSVDSADNSIAFNEFNLDKLAVHLRSSKNDWLFGNRYKLCEKQVDADDASTPFTKEIEAESWQSEPLVLPFGLTNPVGARALLRGRENIIMGEWGPWDHLAPLIRLGNTSGNQINYEIFSPPAGNWEYTDLLTGKKSAWAVAPTTAKPLQVAIVTHNGVQPYKYEVSNGLGWSRIISGTAVGAWWTVKCFSWDDSCDPRKDPAAWRRRADADDVLIADPGSLSLTFGHGGPGDIKWVRKRQEPPKMLPGKDRFGTISSAKLKLPKGSWRISTLSDDGVRVLVNGKPIIERWNWHAPTRDEAVYEQQNDGEVEIMVEHFEIDGYAVLTLDIEQADGL